MAGGAAVLLGPPAFAAPGQVSPTSTTPEGRVLADAVTEAAVVGLTDHEYVAIEPTSSGGPAAVSFRPDLGTYSTNGASLVFQVDLPTYAKVDELAAWGTTGVTAVLAARGLDNQSGQNLAVVDLTSGTPVGTAGVRGGKTTLATPYLARPDAETLRVFVNNTGPGDTSYVTGVRVGYLPFRSKAFAPVRVYDSRDPRFGPPTRLSNGEEREHDLSPYGALWTPGVPYAAALLNVTVTATAGAGFLALFPSSVAWPGTSNINWFGPGQDLAASSAVQISPTGFVKVRAGGGSTHYVVDLFGFLA